MWWPWHKTHRHQQNRILSVEINPSIYGQLIFVKGVKKSQRVENHGAEKNWLPHLKGQNWTSLHMQKQSKIG